MFEQYIPYMPEMGVPFSIYPVFSIWLLICLWQSFWFRAQTWIFHPWITFFWGGGGIQVIQQLYFLTHWSHYSLICVRKCQFYVFHQDHSQLPLIVACEIPSDWNQRQENAISSNFVLRFFFPTWFSVTTAFKCLTALLA